LIPLITGRFLTQDRAQRVGLIASGSFAAWLFVSWTAALHPLNAWHNARLQGQAELTLLRVAGRSHHNLVDGAFGFLDEQAEFLDSRGFLSPPLVKEPWLDSFSIGKSPLSRGRGIFHQPLIDSDKVTFTGTATLPKSGRPGDAVLICSEEAGRYRIRRIADFDYIPGWPLLHVDYEFTPFHYPTLKWAPSWKAVIPRADFDAAPGWSAWVLDIKSGRVHRLPTEE
jgi:hypothetical protein